MNPTVLAGMSSKLAARGVVPNSWRRVGVALGLGLLLLGVVFNVEIAAAVQIWIQSTAYNHCFLVLPIAAFLWWERRADIAGLTATPMPRAVLLGMPIAAVWLVAERLGIMEGRQLAAISFVELLFLAVLGSRFWWAVSGPLLYLVFLVPFGEFVTPNLQDITTLFIRHGLELLGIPAFIDGNIIEIPQGTFLVAEACAGLRFLIASIAFGCLYALLMYRSPVRRGVFIVISIIVPIIANGLRGFGIVYLGYLLDSAKAGAADHLIYGWLFFSLVIGLLIAAGLPFRQDGAPPSPHRLTASPPISARRGLFAMSALVVVLAAIGPIASAGLAITNGVPVSLPDSIAVGSDCAIVAGALADPHATRVRTQRVTCGDIAIDMTWEAFPPRVTAGPVLLERHRLCRQAETESLIETWLPDTDDQHRAWRILRSDEPASIVAASIWIDGRPSRPGLSMRLRMALDSLFGSAYAPMLMTAAPAAAWQTMTPVARQRADASVVRFLQEHPDLDVRVGTISALR
jgi:exosortase A